jgi:hypothetical protein
MTKGEEKFDLTYYLKGTSSADRSRAAPRLVRSRCNLMLTLSVCVGCVAQPLWPVVCVVR